MRQDEWIFVAARTVCFERGSELSDPLIPHIPAGAAELGPAQTPQRAPSVTPAVALHVKYLRAKEKNRV